MMWRMRNTSDITTEIKTNENYNKLQEMYWKLQSLDRRCDENRILNQNLEFWNLNCDELVCIVIAAILMSCLHSKESLLREGSGENKGRLSI